MKALTLGHGKLAHIQGQTPLNAFPNDALSKTFGQGELLFINGDQANLLTHLQSVKSHPLAGVTAISMSQKNIPAITAALNAGIGSVVPSPETTPSSLSLMLQHFIGGTDKGTPLGWVHDVEQIKSKKFSSAGDWQTFSQQLITFMSKYSINITRTQNLFQRLEVPLIKSGGIFETYTDGTVLACGLQLPIDIKGAKVYCEVAQAIKGLDTPPPNATPGALFFLALNASHFVFARKEDGKYFLCFVYCLKKAPSVNGFSLRFAGEDLCSEIAMANAFATLDPSAITTKATQELTAQAKQIEKKTESTSEQLEKDLEENLNKAAASTKAPPVSTAQPTPKVQSIPTTQSNVDHSLVAETQEKLRQAQTLNILFTQTNKVLGEEIKRLVKMRREPTTDQEIKAVNSQLELKVKKLLIKIMEYNEGLQQAADVNAQMQKELEQLKSEKQELEQRIEEFKEKYDAKTIEAA